MTDVHSSRYRVFIALILVLPAFGQATGQTRESPYEIVMRLRREAAAKQPQTPAGSSVQTATLLGPVIARAELKFVQPGRSNPTNLLGLRVYDTTLVRPTSLKETPADAPPQPVYFVLRIGDREVAGITYRSNRSGGAVKLCLDTDGDGLFSDEKQYAGTWLQWLYPGDCFQFGPVSTLHGDATSKRGVCYVQCSGGRSIILYTAFYREGTLLLDGKTYKIALIDSDFDGRFDRFFKPPAADSHSPGCDVFAMDFDGDSKFNYGQPGDSEIMPLSKMVRVGGQYYGIEVAEDGSAIEFRRAEPAFGHLDLGGEEVLLGLWSDAAQQRPSSAGGKLRLPAGKYSLVSLDLTETDAANRWTFQLAKGGAGPLKDFEIKPGQTTAFQIGPPFQIRTSMQRYGQNLDVTIGFELQGQGGERYTSAPKKDGKEAPEPSIKILDGAGRVVQSGRFAYS